MAFRNIKLSSCHLAPIAVMSADKFCAQCGAADPKTVEEIDYYTISEFAELAVRKFADGDMKWAQLSNVLMGEVNEFKEKIVNDLRLQMADRSLSAYIFNPDRERWVKVDAQ